MNIKFYYTKKIGIEKADYNGNISIKYIMEILQKISTDSANSLGFGHELVRKNNLAWVLNKIKLEFARPIKIDEEITFCTWPIAPKHYTAERDYVAYDKDKNIVLKGTSVWNLIDLQKRTLTSTEIVKDIKVDYSQDRAFLDNVFNRIRFNENYVLAYKKQIKISDLDINNHVNNTNYYSYAIDCLQTADYNKTIKMVDIRFHQELLILDEVDIYYLKQNNDNFIIGKKQDKEVFSAQIVLND